MWGTNGELTPPRTIVLDCTRSNSERSKSLGWFITLTDASKGDDVAQACLGAAEELGETIRAAVHDPPAESG